jgi:hypothetical protein
MKLKNLIKKLQKLDADYTKKHGTDAVIFDLEVVSGLIVSLCAGKKRVCGITQAIKPYMEKEIKLK